MMFLLGAFLTGGVLGFSADRYMNRDRVCTTGGSGNLQAVMSERLGLTAGQRDSIDAILDERSRQYRVAMEPIRARLDSIKLNARDQMRGVLTGEQQAEFEALIAEMNDTTKRKDDR